MTGTIKRKIEDKKFGFIAPEDGTADVFFHEGALSGVTFEELNEGDKVTFDKEMGPKGPAAQNVTRVQ